jgi:YaiO family outer membrane protein
MRLIAAIFLGLFLWHSGEAQVDTLKLSADDLFSLARQKAFDGQREEARRLCAAVLRQSPSYLDARVLLGRTYAWDQRWDEAGEELQKVLAVNPAHRDALSALLDVELWRERYSPALDIADEALRSYPSGEEFLLKKARALIGLGREGQALLVLNALEDLNPSLADIAALRRNIRSTAMKTGIGINYAADRFSDTYGPMNSAFLQLSRRTSYGSFFARLNYATRFGSRGVQVETDLYPRLADGVYAYLNYGYSPSDLFPRHRAGAELYTKLPSSYEGSAGLRHLYFGPASSVTIYTGSLGLYFGSYWISVRPYFIPNDAGLSNSGSITLRRYFGDAENFVSLKAGAGFSADERTIQSSTGFSGQEIFYLKSQTVGLGWQQSLSTYLLFVAMIDLTNQEISFRPGSYTMMYSLSLGLRATF